MDSVQYNNRPPMRVVRAYYTGTGLLRKGQCLAYTNIANAPLPDTSTTDDRKLEQCNNVWDFSSTSGHTMMAGVVGESSVGKTGPCYIDLVVPQSGDMLQVECDGTGDITAETTYVIPDAAGTLGAMIAGTILVTSRFRAFSLETWATDATKKAIWLMFF